MTGDGDHDEAVGNELDIPGLANLRRVAVGSSGIVYRAEDLRHDRTVAVKVLNRGTVDADSELALERELAAMGRLSTHPNIIDLYDSGTTHDRHPYIVMPYYERGNYADLVDEFGPLSWQEVVDFGVKIAGALHTAHTRGFVHRDVKPANIFRGEFERQPILADFGIASFASPGVGGSFTVKVSTTPLYGAPEVLEGERPTERSDIYSFGASLFALVDGLPAFTDPSTDVVVHRVTAARNPPRPTAPIPTELADLLGRLMARNPTHRPATCLAIARQLVEIQKANGIDPTAIVSDGAAEPAAPVEPSGVESPASSAPIAAGRSDEPAPTPEPRARPRIESIGEQGASRPPSFTRPVDSLDRPTEPVTEQPQPPRRGPLAVPRARPAWQWAALAAVCLLIAAVAYTTLVDSGPNPGELMDRAVDDPAAAATLAAWGEVDESTRWEAHSSAWVTDLAYAPTGPDLVTAGTDGVVRVWPAPGADEATTEFNFADWVIDVDWSSDGTALAVAATDGIVAVGPAGGGEPVVLDRSGSSAEAVAWDPTGTQLLTGYAGGQIVMRSAADGTADATVFEGHDGDLLDLAWAPTGDRAVTSAKDGRVIVWNTNTGEPVAVIEDANGGWTRSVQWVAATLFLTTDDDGPVALRSVETGSDTVEELARIDIGRTVLASDLRLGDNVLLAAAYEDGSVRIWDLVTGDEAAELSPATSEEEGGATDATAVSWSSDGRTLAIGRLDGTVQTWSLD